VTLPRKFLGVSFLLPTYVVRSFPQLEVVHKYVCGYVLGFSRRSSLQVTIETQQYVNTKYLCDTLVRARQLEDKNFRATNPN